MGWTETFGTVVGIGPLDAVSAPVDGGGYPLGAFKIALTVQYLVWAVGPAGVLRTRRRMRRALAERGVHIDPRAIVRRLATARSS